MSCCQNNAGPGYATPLDAFNSGTREKLLYIPAVVPDHSRPDYIVTVDVDTESPTYSQVIHRLPLGKGDELHHSGWNACSSCFGDASKTRKLLILPALGSGRIYAVDVASDARAPKLHKVVEPADYRQTSDASFLHTSHCLGSGDIMISAMGDGEGNNKGSFLLLDHELKPKGNWSKEETKYGYDYWYQPRLNVMVSTSWGSPKAFSKGFNPAEIASSYGDQIYFWDWEKRKVTQEVSLGPDGLIPLETRFLHRPDAPHGYVGAALSSNVIHFTKDPEAEGKWKTSVAVRQPWVKVEGWVLPELPPLITDILISLDDRFLYIANWLRGDISQFDITDPASPRLAGRVWLGGVIRKGSAVTAAPESLQALDLTEAPEIPQVKGVELQGGPQMIQLSLDGRRLYVTNSLYSPWDGQFYPELVKKGSYLLQIDVDIDNGGGLKVNPEFLVDFGAEPDGPVLAHEVRYPGGDCSSDIWL